jgi:hypothetical protein
VPALFGNVRGIARILFLVHHFLKMQVVLYRVMPSQIMREPVYAMLDGGIAQLLLVEFQCCRVLAENDSAICRTVGDD